LVYMAERHGRWERVNFTQISRIIVASAPDSKRLIYRVTIRER
jgi:hypothetical protein